MTAVNLETITYKLRDSFDILQEEDVLLDER